MPRPSFIAFWLLLLTMALLAGGPSARAQNRSDTSRPNKTEPARNKKPGKPAKAVELTAEREAAALTFAQQFHPELAELIKQLGQTNEREYVRALRDLHRASERLASIRNRSVPRYERELALWKLESRIRLLAARLTMAPDPALEDELLASLEQQIELKLDLLKFEREEAAARLEKLDASIARMEENPAAHAREALERLLRGAEDARKSKKTENAEKPPKNRPAQAATNKIPDKNRSEKNKTPDKAKPGTSENPAVK